MDSPIGKRIRMVAGAVLDTVRLCYYIQDRHCGDTIALRCALQILHAINDITNKLREMQEDGHPSTVNGRIQAKRLKRWIVGRIKELWGLEDPYPSITRQPTDPDTMPLKVHSSEI